MISSTELFARWIRNPSCNIYSSHGYCVLTSKRNSCLMEKTHSYCLLTLYRSTDIYTWRPCGQLPESVKLPYGVMGSIEFRMQTTFRFYTVVQYWTSFPWLHHDNPIRSCTKYCRIKKLSIECNIFTARRLVLCTRLTPTAAMTHFESSCIF